MMARIGPAARRHDERVKKAPILIADIDNVGGAEAPQIGPPRLSFGAPDPQNAVLRPQKMRSGGDGQCIAPFYTSPSPRYS